jgi:hypothetical protein
MPPTTYGRMKLFGQTATEPKGELLAEGQISVKSRTRWVLKIPQKIAVDSKRLYAVEFPDGMRVAGRLKGDLSGAGPYSVQFIASPRDEDRFYELNPNVYEDEWPEVVYFGDRGFKTLENIFQYVEGHRIHNGLKDFIAFPSELGPHVEELHNKAWNVFFAHRQMTEHQRYNGKSLPLQWLQESISDNWPEIEKVISEQYDKGNVRLRIILEGKPLLLLVDSFLMELKAALDILAKLLCRGLRLDRSPLTFGKGKTATGKPDVGGEFIKILETKAPAETAGAAKQIADIFRKHKTKWLDRAVNLRDTVSHYRSLQSDLRIELRISGGDKSNRSTELAAKFKGEDIFKILRETRDGFGLLLGEVFVFLKKAEFPQNPSIKKASKKFFTA